MQFECRSSGIAAIMRGLIVRPPSMSGFCCVIFMMLFGSSGRRKQQQVQRVQEENGDLRQLILQLEKGEG